MHADWTRDWAPDHLMTKLIVNSAVHKSLRDMSSTSTRQHVRAKLSQPCTNKGNTVTPRCHSEVGRLGSKTRCLFLCCGITGRPNSDQAKARSPVCHEAPIILLAPGPGRAGHGRRNTTATFTATATGNPNCGGGTSVRFVLVEHLRSSVKVLLRITTLD
jgi:hypothetical protein